MFVRSIHLLTILSAVLFLINSKPARYFYIYDTCALFLIDIDFRIIVCFSYPEEEDEGVPVCPGRGHAQQTRGEI